ncbi:ATP-binding protein [Chitinibacteraceae bacterium HSL-7]
MFQIKELEMVHWDFWQAIRVPLDAQIVTIVGPNGSGKTTLLDAMRTLLALKCSGRRDYKRYVRNNRENYAWLRGVVSNPRRGVGGLFPYLFFPITADEVTLFCRVKKQGGDWVRQYAIAEGNVALTPDTESLLTWIGVNEYKRRLEQAGLTPAIAEVLALEQGDTDKLCEYSPKALLDLVFQVFGDKEVLDHYAEAKLKLKEAEGELVRMDQQLSQLGLDVERLRLRANNHLEWRQLAEDIGRLERETLLQVGYAELGAQLRQAFTQYRAARKLALTRRDEMAGLDTELGAAQAQYETALGAEQGARKAYDDGFAAFQQARDAARDTEKTLKEGERLRELAELEHGADAVALNDQLGKVKEEVSQLRHTIRTLKDERQQLSEAQFALQQGRPPQPEFVRTMRAALDEAGIRHQMLTEIVEVLDPRWQEAVEALMAPYRHIVLLERESDRQRAWEIGQRVKYRHFVVPDREPAPRANRGSVLEVVDFRADAPTWLTNILNRTQRAESVAAGQRIDGDWITRDGYHKERRGARDISVRAGDYAFGEGARQSQQLEVTRRLAEINTQLLRDESTLATRERRVSELTQSLMGMQAVVQLAARQEEFASAAARFGDEERRAQACGAALAAAQSAWEDARNLREDSRIRYEKLKDQRGRIAVQHAALAEGLARQRDDVMRPLRGLRAQRESLPAALLAADALAAVAQQYGSVREVQHLIEREKARLNEGHWETDPSILARRDKLAGDYGALETDAQVHRSEVDRTGQLTDDARAAYINKLKATVRAYGRNVKRLGELAGIEVEIDPPALENDDIALAQAGLTVRFNFDQKGMMGLNDGEASGGQQVMKSLILLIGLMMDDANPTGFVFIDEPFAHLDIFNIDRVGGFLKATQAQYLITTPLTHNTNVYGPSELTLTTRKKQPGQTWAPLIAQTRRRVRTDAPAKETA